MKRMWIADAASRLRGDVDVLQSSSDSDSLGAVSGVGGKDSPMIPAGPSTTPRCKPAVHSAGILLSPVLRNDADVTFGLFAQQCGGLGESAQQDAWGGGAQQGSKYR